MAVQNTRERTRVLQDGAIEISELGVDRRERGNRVPFAEHEQILTRTRRVGDIHVDKATVVQRDERNRRRERASGMETLVDRIATLLECEQPDVGVFDG